MSVGKLKNGMVVAKDGIKGDTIKNGGELGIDWTWRLCNIAFENGLIPEDWRSTVIVLLYKDKGEMNECENYKGIYMFSVVEKIYAKVLLERVQTD